MFRLARKGLMTLGLISAVLGNVLEASPSFPVVPMGFWMSPDSTLHRGSCEAYPKVSNCKSESSVPFGELEKGYVAGLREAYLNHAQASSVGLSVFGETPRPQIYHEEAFGLQFQRVKRFFDAIKGGAFNGPSEPEGPTNVSNPSIDDVVVWLDGRNTGKSYPVAVNDRFDANFSDTLFQIPLRMRDNAPLSVTPHLILSRRVDLRLPVYFRLSNCSPSFQILGVIGRNVLNPKSFYLAYLARDTARTRDLTSFQVVFKRDRRDDTDYPGCTLTAKVVPAVDCYERLDRPACYDETFGQCRWNVKRKTCWGEAYLRW